MNTTQARALEETTGIEPHNQRSAAVWNAGGAPYDEISRSIADAIEHSISRLSPQPGEHILDVATGTGWAARRVAQRGAETIGVDIGASLVDAAKRYAAQQQLRIDFRVADAERLPFADGRFDGVISTFGVMFTTRPEQAASELARVCRKGGRLALATWLPNSAVFQMFLAMKPYMPANPNPPPSPFEWGRQDRVTELLGEAFELRFEQGTSQYHLADGEEAWRAFEGGYGPTRSLAANLDDERRRQLKADFVAFHERFRTPLGITVPRNYLVTIGRRR